MHEDLKKTLDVLYNGGIILFPTDSVWCMGCDATNEKAVQRLIGLHNTPQYPMCVLIDTSGKLASYLDEVPDLAWDLIEMTEKPLTIIYSQSRNLSPSLLDTDKSIGIRVTNEAFSRNLCTRFKKPIVAMPVNEAGNRIPENFQQISAETKSGVDYVVQFRQDDLNKPIKPSIIKLGKGNLFQLINE
jgi:L-threonylcarbamoyladenylate synthase